MKFFKTIAKNFKTLFRLRLSLIAIILGPVLVLALIGFAFNSSSNIQLTVGYFAPDNSSLTSEFVDTLQTKDFTVKSFEAESLCLKELKLGLLHTCVIFPPDFEIRKDQVSNITFYVDKSRVNIAYNVIDSVSENIGIKSDELSKSLTETLTNTLTSTSGNIDDALGIIIKLKRNVESASDDAQTISNDLAGMDLEVGGSIAIDTDVNTLAGYTTKLADDINDTVIEGLSLIDTLRSDGGNATLLNDFESLLNDLNTAGSSRNTNAITLSSSIISDTASQLSDIETQLEDAKKLNENSREKIASLKENLAGIASDVDRAKSLLESTVSDIGTIEITSSDQIINPINTKIETIASENNQLVILFPYVLMLIVMFVGMMLSSTLVVVEKKSRASFRIFTTPTRDEFFILTTFITAFIIVAVQVIVILSAAGLFIVDIITANLLVNAIITALAAAIFIMIGMAVGYLLPNQQGTNMASISLGAIFLFISNIVLPLETISPYLREIAAYNPYVIASEVLRKSILFGISVSDITKEISILTLYSILVVGLIIIFQRLSKAWYFKKNPQTKIKRVSYSHEYLYINQEKVSTEKQFIEQIKKMSDGEYKKWRRKNHHDLHIFVGEKLSKKSIAKRVTRLERKQLLAEFGEANVELMENLKPESKEKEKKEEKKKN
ncbi:MAG: ABC transporter permease [Nanoarchaeota archaeon]|nr:ABC transporter permease [Nanoarchaeota archaeon]